MKVPGVFYALFQSDILEGCLHWFKKQLFGQKSERRILEPDPARPALGEARGAPAGDATIEYLASGPREGAVVVLFPSYARSAADFNELMGDLAAAGFRTFAVQPHGIEGSTLPSGDPTYHTYAENLLAVLDAAEMGALGSFFAARRSPGSQPRS